MMPLEYAGLHPEFIAGGAITKTQMEEALTFRVVTLVDAVIEAGTYRCLDNTRLRLIESVSFLSESRLIMGNGCTLVGDYKKTRVKNLHIFFPPACVDALVCNISGSVDYNNKIALVTMDADALSVPTSCTVLDCCATGMYAAYRVRGALKCIFSGNIAEGCVRGFIVLAAERCLFDKEESIYDRTTNYPIVGFLNIATVTETFHRGIINNRYRDITITGWAEEGFSFDARGNEINDRALRLNTHVIAATSAGITVTAYSEEDLSGCDVVFHTGALAGRYYRIESNAGNTINIKEFVSEFSQVVVGDFIGVEVSCAGNTISSLSVYGKGDKAGVCIWLWGGRSTFIGTRLKNTVIYIRCAAVNTKPANSGWNNLNYFGAPHQVSLIDTKWLDEPYYSSGRTAYGIDASNCSDASVYDPAITGDDITLESNIKIRNLSIIGGRPTLMKIGNVDALDVEYLGPFDVLLPQSKIKVRSYTEVVI